MENEDEIMNAAKAAKRIGVTKVTLHRYRKAGILRPHHMTKGGHYRFLESEIDRFLREQQGETRIEFDEASYQPFPVRRWLTEKIAAELPETFRRVDPSGDQRNSITVRCDLLHEEINFTFTKKNAAECPLRLVRRDGDTSFSMTIAFEHPPTLGQATEGFLSFVEEALTSIFFVLREGLEVVHSSSHLRVQPLRYSGWYWLWIKEHPYILRLPARPTDLEWKVFATKSVVAYQALLGMTFTPPPFSFIKKDGEEILNV